MDQADKKGIIGRYYENDFPVVLKFINELPDESTLNRFSFLTVVSWDYDGSQNNGMPPLPSLTVLTTTVDGVETAYNSAQNGDRSSKQVLKEKVKEMDGLISTLGAYIQAESGGDEVKILSSGALVRKQSNVPKTLGAPVGFLATVGAKEGTIDLKWKTMEGAKSFQVEIASDLLGTTWKQAAICNAAGCTITGLESGKKYLLRVAAVNGNGTSPWSDPGHRHGRISLSNG